MIPIKDADRPRGIFYSETTGSECLRVQPQHMTGNFHIKVDKVGLKATHQNAQMSPKSITSLINSSKLTLDATLS